MEALKTVDPVTLYDQLSSNCPNMLVIFETDGTLYDYERFYHYAAYDALSMYNDFMPHKEKLSNFLVGFKVANQLDRIKEFFKLNSLDLIIPDGFEVLRDIRLSQLFHEKESQITNGIVEFITLLKTSGIRFCLASRSERDVLSIKLKKTGLNSFFNPGNIFLSNDIHAQMIARYTKKHGLDSKLLPEHKTAIFVKAAACYGYNPENCFVIGSTFDGMQSAINGKMNALCFTGAPNTNQLHTIEQVSKILSEKLIFNNLL